MDFTGKFISIGCSKTQAEEVLSGIASKCLYDKNTKIESIVAKDYAGKIKDISRDGKEFIE